MKMGQSVPKRRHIKFRRRRITQKKAYNELHCLHHRLGKGSGRAYVCSTHVFLCDAMYKVCYTKSLFFPLSWETINSVQWRLCRSL